MFPYSERPGTAALRIPLVVEEVEKKERVARLIELSERKRQMFYTKNIGRSMDVLFEKTKSGKAMHGFTPNYIRVELPPEMADPLLDNKIVNVTLGDFNMDKTALMANINY